MHTSMYLSSNYSLILVSISYLICTDNVVNFSNTRLTSFYMHTLSHTSRIEYFAIIVLGADINYLRDGETFVLFC